MSEFGRLMMRLHGQALYGLVVTRIADSRVVLLVLLLALAQVAVAARPNVLFIIADDLNVALGSYADAARVSYATAKTPHLDRLAAQGVRFDRAYVQNPLCNPSRTSMLSGLRPPSTNIYDGQTDPRDKIGDLVLLPEHFNAHGYFTARVGKIAHNRFESSVRWDVSSYALGREPGKPYHWPGYLPGTDLSAIRDNTWTDGSENGMSRAQVLAPLGRSLGLPLSWRATSESPNLTPDGTTATRIIELLETHADQPFFIAAGFHKPHQPWVVPTTFFEQHPVDEIELPRQPFNHVAGVPEAVYVIREDDAAHSDQQRKQAIAAYHSAVTMVDSYVGQLMAALRELGLEKSTIVVFTSDHGFHLNEHGGMWRKQSQFEESTRVPLIVRVPGTRQEGQVTSGLVELVDLYPTLLALTDLPPPEHRLEGTSFAPLLATPDLPWKNAAFSESKRQGHHGRSIRTDRYRYTEWSPLSGDGPVAFELYDLAQDPREFNNLAGDAAHGELAENLSRRLETGWQGALPR